MSKIGFLLKLNEIGAIKFGEFTLKSGKKSPYYIDLRILSSYPKVLVEAATAIEEIIQNQSEKPTRLCGIPMAGLAIANILGVRTGIPSIYTRKEPIIYKDLAKQLNFFIQEGKYQPHEITTVEKIIELIEEMSGFKTHGITRYVDGVLQDGDKIGIVDDLITTADSKLEARDLIMLEAKRRNIKVSVSGVYVLLDREQGGKEALKKEGLNFYSLGTMTEVAKLLHDQDLISHKKYNIIIDYINSERN